MLSHWPHRWQACCRGMAWRGAVAAAPRCRSDNGREANQQRCPPGQVPFRIRLLLSLGSYRCCCSCLGVCPGVTQPSAPLTTGFLVCPAVQSTAQSATAQATCLSFCLIHLCPEPFTQQPPRSCSGRSRTVVDLGERWCAFLESLLGATPREFESRILRQAIHQASQAFGARPEEPKSLCSASVCCTRAG